MPDAKCKREVYKRDDNKWAWRLIGDNGSDIIATDGGQGYTTKVYCVSMMRQVTSGRYKNCPEDIQAGE
jgi:uncharacterized protein YegP (UPF0339 family)